MAKFKLALGLHNHQPVGNFEAVFQGAHDKAYRPFLELLQEYDTIRMSLHESGILWNWQEHAHPEFFELVGKMVDRGRIELMTGGFYEPILISVPGRDAVGQIAMLNDYIKRHFETDPTGLWLTERIWEPHLPSLLAESGVRYLPIDDTHFLYAGMSLKQLTGPFVTEDQGRRLTLLPIQKRLRYLIPFGKVDDLIGELKAQAERNPEGLAVYADDGEKFGVWPETHEHCYQDGWLRRFFKALADNSDWLEVITLGEAADLPAAGRAYLPSASYAEMLHWALPTSAGSEYDNLEHWLKEQEQFERYSRFVRGGHWRGFLTKYEESNLMHKRMLAVSDRLADCEARLGGSETIEKARDRLYAGQCNCPYWHGVFGGLYLPHIRQAIHSALITADSILDSIDPPDPPIVTRVDYDMDGHDEIVWRDSAFTAVIKPSEGGTLRELALKEYNFSLTDTLTRRREAYHAKLDRAVLKRQKRDETASIHDLVLTKEPNLKEYLVEDWYLKRCFTDHFFTDDVDFDRFRSGRYGEEGDFIVEPWQASLSRQNGSVHLRRDGHLWRTEESVPVTIEKVFRFNADTGRVDIDYRLSTSSQQPVRVKFGIENNFNFQAGHAEDRFVLVDGRRTEESYLDSSAAHDNHFSVAMIDQYRDLGLVLTSNVAGNLWQCPIWSVSLSEAGFERTYQGTTLVKVYRLTLTQDPTTIHLSLTGGRPAELPIDQKLGTAARSS